MDDTIARTCPCVAALPANAGVGCQSMPTEHASQLGPRLGRLGHLQAPPHRLLICLSRSATTRERCGRDDAAAHVRRPAGSPGGYGAWLACSGCSASVGGRGCGGRAHTRSECEGLFGHVCTGGAERGHAFDHRSWAHHDHSEPALFHQPRIRWQGQLHAKINPAKGRSQSRARSVCQALSTGIAVRKHTVDSKRDIAYHGCYHALQGCERRTLDGQVPPAIGSPLPKTRKSTAASVTHAAHSVVSDTIGRTGHRESVVSGTHVWLACRSEPRCGRTVGRPLACVPCAHWTHRRSEERDSADDTIAVARRGQIDRALVADLLVGGKNVQCGRDAPSARPFSWHEHGGHRCHPRRRAVGATSSFDDSIEMIPSENLD